MKNIKRFWGILLGKKYKMLKICLNFRGSDTPKRAEMGWFIWVSKDHILACRCSFAVPSPARDNTVNQIWAILCLKNCGSKLWNRIEFMLQKTDLFTCFPSIPNMTYLYHYMSKTDFFYKKNTTLYQFLTIFVYNLIQKSRYFNF